MICVCVCLMKTGSVLFYFVLFDFEGFGRGLLGKEGDCNTLLVIVEKIEIGRGRTLKSTTRMCIFIRYSSIQQKCHTGGGNRLHSFESELCTFPFQ